MPHGDDTRVWRARDRVGGQELAYKQITCDSTHARDIIIERIRLSQRLGQAGFLSAQDLTAESDGSIGFTTRMVPAIPFDREFIGANADSLLGILAEIAWGMGQLHRLDYVHGDLKPSNILIEMTKAGPRAWIADLDWAVRRSTQRVTAVLGSEAYMAPEVTTGGALTETTDIFSFGVILRNDVLPHLSTGPLSGQLSEIADRCLRLMPESPLNSFEKVRSAILSAAGRHGLRLENTRCVPAFRDAGLRARVAALNLLSDRADRALAHGLLVSAPPWGGKSRVIREACLQQQLAGRETLRVEGVRSLQELHHALTSWREAVRTAGGDGAEKDTILVYAESDPEADFDSQEWPGMAGVQLIIEGRWPEHLPKGMALYRVPAWNRRECIVAIGHLHDNAPLNHINAEGLHIASGGIPGVAVRQVGQWLTNPRRTPQSEALDFDHLDPEIEEYWDRRFQGLPSETQNILRQLAVFHDQFRLEDLSFIPSSKRVLQTDLGALTNLGWLTRDTHDGAYRIVARSARNFLCRITSRDLRAGWASQILARMERASKTEQDSDIGVWHLKRVCNGGVDFPGDPGTGRLQDIKLATFGRLCAFRRARRVPGAVLAEDALTLSRAFERLGSTARRMRWAVNALDRLGEERGAEVQDIGHAKLLCEIFNLALEPPRVGEQIAAVIAANRTIPPQVQGFFLSELGGHHLWMGRYPVGGDLCLQSHHLLGVHAPKSEEFARNLNRLGLASIRAGRFDSAKRYLEEGLRLSRERGYDAVEWRCYGNLGLVARERGEPGIAMDCSRQAVRYCRNTGQTANYVSALMNRCFYLVDLGQGHRAERAARVAHMLAEMFDDPAQLGHTTNNLGWILTMQGRAGEAYQYLRESIRLRRRVGDQVCEEQTVINMAWLALLMRRQDDAERLSQSTLAVLTEQGHLHGLCEARLISSIASMQRGDYPGAEVHLRQIPVADPALAPRDRAATELTRAQIVFAEKDPDACAATVDSLRRYSPILSMNPLTLEFRRLEGLSLLYQGEYDAAYNRLMALGKECRATRRLDHLIETMGAQIELAQRMGNATVARRYADSARQQIAQMEKEVPWPLTRNV